MTSHTWLLAGVSVHLVEAVHGNDCLPCSPGLPMVQAYDIRQLLAAGLQAGNAEQNPPLHSISMFTICHVTNSVADRTSSNA